jgi:hypothetical protein
MQPAQKGGHRRESGPEKMINRKSTTIWACGMICCLSLFVAITPIAGGGHPQDAFSPKMIAALLFSWGLVITTCLFLVKCKRKRHLH